MQATRQAFVRSNGVMVDVSNPLSRYIQQLTAPSIQSLLLFFGPLVLPKALAFYRSLRAPSTVQPRPLTPSTSYAINALFLTAIIFLASTLPIFGPSNIFQTTQSRLQTPTSVLFTRLSIKHALSPADKTLQAVFEASGLEARLHYLRFGPSILTCPFADPKASDASTTYLFYALPSLLAPHLAHLAILGAVTSSRLAGPEAGRWRTAATIAGLALAAADIGAVASYDHLANARATRLSDIDAFFWRLKVYRGIAVAAVDALLGWVIWLSDTRRAFVVPAPAAQRLEESTKLLEAVLFKIRGLGAVRNVVFRDSGMRHTIDEYWVKEGDMMRHVYEERAVVDALRDSLEKVDMARLGVEADVYVQGILGPEQTERG